MATEVELKPARLVPTEAMGSLDSMVQAVGRMVADLKMEADDLALQWEGLVAVGGGREDHAAVLLGRLRSHFNRLAQYSLIVGEQLDNMVADPFGRES